MAKQKGFFRPSSPFIFAEAEPRLNLDEVEINSARLILRPVSGEFAEPIFADFTPEIARFLIARSPTQLSETAGYIAEAVENRRQGTDLSLVILHRETHEFLGGCGLHNRKSSREPELGIWIKKSAHGHAYGREAIAALCAWGERALVVDAFLYPVDRQNIPSRKIPESLGAKIVGAERVPTMSDGELDIVIYRIPVDEKRENRKRENRKRE